ncbi:MAG: T9SS type A sorting domain-containing protein [Bacteroidota bacterium]
MSKQQQHQKWSPSIEQIAISVGGVLFLAFLLFSVFNSEESLVDCNVTYPGDTGVINLAPGDSLCIPNGSNFTGTITAFPTGSKITLQEGASFKPSTVSTVAGIFYNQGEAHFPTVTLGVGFNLQNLDTVSFAEATTISGAITIDNYTDGRIAFLETLQFGSSSELENFGIIYFNQAFEMINSSTIDNNGYILVQEDILIDATVNNMGMLAANEAVTVESNASLVNSCGLLSNDGFTNNASGTQNSGVILVEGINGFPNDLIEINEPFFNGPEGYLAGVRFINNSTVTGTGNFYFAGQTTNNGSFGDDAQGINFYDGTFTGTIMDIQNTLPDGSVTRVAETIPDSFYIPNGCDVSFFPDFLPVEWNEMSVKLEDKVGVVAWSTSKEVNHDYFQLERSADGMEFEALQTVKNPIDEQGETRYYEAKDTDVAQLGINEVFYRIRQVDIDGNASLSQILRLPLTATLDGFKISIPNPVMSSNMSVIIENDRSGNAYLEVMDLQGKLIQKETISVNAGFSRKTVALRDIPSGMYVVKVGFMNQQKSQKVLIYPQN